MSERKRISDEIRNDFVRGDGVDANSYYKLLSIANRIDSEMVELPVSADGKTWTGRETCFWTDAEQEGRHSFGCVALRCGNWYVEDTDGMEFAAGSVWFERPDSFERIAGELYDMATEEGQPDYTCERLASIAERIYRLAGEEAEGGKD